MSCVDCHNPHGSIRPAMTQTFGANEPGCLNCHGDKRGPFTFEHGPVRFEGCATCHEPHGSANPRMLTRQDVRLCLSGVPCQSADGKHHRRTIGVVPPAFHDLLLPQYPELHGMPSEDPRKLRGQESAEMTATPLLLAVMVVPLLASRGARARSAGARSCGADSSSPSSSNAGPSDTGSCGADSIFTKSGGAGSCDEDSIPTSSSGASARNAGFSDTGCVHTGSFSKRRGGPAQAASPVPSAEDLVQRLHRRGLHLAQQRRRQLRRLPEHRKSRLGTEADRRRLYHPRSQASPLRRDPRSRLRLGRRSVRDLPSGRQKIETVRIQCRLPRHRLLRFPAFLRRSAAGAGRHAQ